MSAFEDCILRKTQNGTLDRKAGKEVRGLYEELRRKYRAKMDSASADAKAAADAQAFVAARVLKENENRIKAALFQQQTAIEIDRIHDIFKNQYGRLNIVGKGVYRGFGGGAPTYGQAVGVFLERVYDHAKAVQRDALRGTFEAIEAYGSHWLGFKQDATGFLDVVREMTGGKSGNADAVRHAGMFRQVLDMLHERYAAGGAFIGKLENYFPQAHVDKLVEKAGFDTWKQFITPLLDWDKMIDPKTGFPLDGMQRELALKGAFDSISTGGLNKFRDAVASGKQSAGVGGDISKRHQDGRFLHFKDTEAFLTYNRQFGVGDTGLFNVLMGHIQSMSRDVALIERMGPGANGLMRHLDLRMTAQKTGKTRRNFTNSMYDMLSGRGQTAGEPPMLFKAIEGIKDLQRATKLGFAPLSAMTDSTFVAMAADMNGLPITDAMGKYFKSAGGSENKRTLARMGFTADALVGMGFSTARHMEDSRGPAMTRALANAAHRGSGLAAMTEWAKGANVLELTGFLAEAKHKGWKLTDMPKRFQEMAALRGIDQKTFGKWMKADLWENPDYPDATFLVPEKVAAIDPQAAADLAAWMERIAAQTANEPTLATRAITSGGFTGADTSADSFGKLFWSSTFMFKGFTISMMINHLQPAMRRAAEGKLGSLAMLALGSTMLGAVAVQATEVAKGRDARDMTKGDFWAAAMMKGGGLGIYGDLAFNDLSMATRSFTDTLMGPIWGGLLNKSVETVLGRGKKSLFLGDEKANFARELVNLTADNIPFSKMWYYDLVVERTIKDGMRRLADPNYGAKAQRIMNLHQKNFGNRYYWEIGQTTPNRAPQITGGN